MGGGWKQSLPNAVHSHLFVAVEETLLASTDKYDEYKINQKFPQ